MDEGVPVRTWPVPERQTAPQGAFRRASPPPLSRPTAPPPAPARPHPAPPLLDDLAARGLIGRGGRALVGALSRHAALDMPGILRSQRLVGERPLAEALARRAGLVCIDLDAAPPDTRLPARGHACLTASALPWRSGAEGVTLALADPSNAAAAQAALPPGERLAGLVVAPAGQLRRHILRLHAAGMVERAHRLCPEAMSCRGLPGGALGPFLLVVGLLPVVAGLWLGIGAVMLAALAVALLVLVANTVLRVLSVASFIARRRRASTGAPEAPALPADLPIVSILVPLHREAMILPRLRARLSRLDYPPALLDLCFIVEEDDQETRAALATVGAEAQVIVVPAHGLKTKPLAMNYALPFARGSIIGIYDAEDAPAPGQVALAVARLAAAPPDVACVQSRLGFYNARESWITRCFALDYATWYGVVLPGLQALGGVVTLGGTSLFFRREVLEELGGWDAHNVTEDADLGVRLARRGWRVELLDSETLEEAVARPWPWIRQRSRWIKGFLLTWAVHMRSPRLLLSDLGLWRFVGVQVILLGGPLSALTAPFLWGMALLAFGGALPGLEHVPGPVLWGTGLFMALAQIVFTLSSALAAASRGRRWLWPWILALPVYYLMATAAALKALAEIALLPFFWDKTEHGAAPLRPG